jgi:Family of unknown function (DUF7009)
LPKSKVMNWANADEVSLFAEQKLSGSNTLSLLIEKDFKCLQPGHNRGCANDEDTFPHPRAETADAWRKLCLWPNRLVDTFQAWILCRWAGREFHYNDSDALTRMSVYALS